MSIASKTFAAVKAILEAKAAQVNAARLVGELYMIGTVNDLNFRLMGYEGGYSPVIEADSKEVLDYTNTPYADQESISLEIFSILLGKRSDSHDFGFLPIEVDYKNGNLFQIVYDMEREEWDVCMTNADCHPGVSFKTKEQVIAYVQENWKA